MEDAPKRIAEAITAAEKTLGLDWRSSYSKLSCDSAGTLRVDLSRREVFRALASALTGAPMRAGSGVETGELEVPELAVRLHLLGAAGSRLLWATSSVADVRRDPAHSAELLTQLIMGERARLLATEGDWNLVRLDDDYHGWIRSWYARETDAGTISSYETRCNTVVDANVCYVLSKPDERSIPISDIVCGVRVSAEAPEDGFRLVELPGGKSGYMRERDLAEWPTVDAPDRVRIVERAMRFLGIPYLWGGTSAKGFDCSGLVKRVYLMEGVRLPRDADRQALEGSLIPRTAVNRAEPGDLLFFGEGGVVSHVAMHIGGAAYIHAYGEVRINSLTPADDRYDERLGSIFLYGRSVIS